ncbi:MAG: Pvc16 family protein [Jaaginema sp. PMC 1079.18]|nr:Pvc16 family protein [Jaaginema sp. PMC 1080.18]MEC4850677.1 Pvc16 family protein [Jaaginema sp. PMC 1079.18]MEC4866505.1 Pvc16 family protein [Jaaginema sp. PMC 1078.18]
MIAAITQTLAEILVDGSSQISTEQIDLGHPGASTAPNPKLNLYFYQLCKNTNKSGAAPDAIAQETKLTTWFDLYFIVTAWDCTVLSEQHLLSESLKLLLRHSHIPAKFLPSGLQSYRELPLKITANTAMKTAAFWAALGIPLRPALYVTITVPFHTEPERGELPISQPQILLNY